MDGLQVWIEASTPFIRTEFKNRDLANSMLALGRLVHRDVDLVPPSDENKSCLDPFFEEIEKRFYLFSPVDRSITIYGLGMLAELEKIKPELVTTCVEAIKKFGYHDEVSTRDLLDQFSGFVRMADCGNNVDPIFIADFEEYLFSRMESFNERDMNNFERIRKALDDIEVVTPYRFSPAEAARRHHERLIGASRIGDPR